MGVNVKLSILYMLNWDTASNRAVPLGGHDSHTYTHTHTHCADTLSESLNHFSNPVIQHPFLYSLYPPSFPSSLLFSSFLILSPSIYPAYSFSVHPLWTDFLVSSHQPLPRSHLSILCPFHHLSFLSLLPKSAAGFLLFHAWPLSWHPFFWLTI